MKVRVRLEPLGPEWRELQETTETTLGLIVGPFNEEDDISSQRTFEYQDHRESGNGSIVTATNSGIVPLSVTGSDAYSSLARSLISVQKRKECFPVPPGLRTPS
jgi:hypothetical protein